MGDRAEADGCRPALARRGACRPTSTAAGLTIDSPIVARRRVARARRRRRRARIRCSREENAELFRLAVGGYGLFGCIYSLRLRLVPRQSSGARGRDRVDRRADAALRASGSRDGFLYGDFQFAIDPASDDFLRRGVFSCYRPVERAGRAARGPAGALHGRLAAACSTSPTRTSARRGSSTRRTTWPPRASSTTRTPTSSPITPTATTGTPRRRGSGVDRTRNGDDHGDLRAARIAWPTSWRAVADDFRDATAPNVDLRDDPAGRATTKSRSSPGRPTAGPASSSTSARRIRRPRIERSAEAFRRLIDRGIERGRQVLTYHRWATREQVETCYPQFAGVPTAEAAVRSRGAVPERVVSPLPRDVRGRPR